MLMFYHDLAFLERVRHEKNFKKYKKYGKIVSLFWQKNSLDM